MIIITTPIKFRLHQYNAKPFQKPDVANIRQNLHCCPSFLTVPAERKNTSYLRNSEQLIVSAVGDISRKQRMHKGKFLIRKKVTQGIEDIFYLGSGAF